MIRDHVKVGLYWNIRYANQMYLTPLMFTLSMKFHLYLFGSSEMNCSQTPSINILILFTVQTMHETVSFYLMLFSGHVIAQRIIYHLLITETIVNFQSSLCGISARQRHFTRGLQSSLYFHCQLLCYECTQSEGRCLARKL